MTPKNKIYINMGCAPVLRPYLLGDLRDGVAREAGVPLVGLNRLGHVVGGVVHGVQGVDLVVVVLLLLVVVVVMRSFVYLYMFICGIRTGGVWPVTQLLVDNRTSMHA